MYKTRQESIANILARLQGTEVLALKSKLTVKYSTDDIFAAKTVLERLLKMSERNEVSYIKIVDTKVEES